MMLNAYMGYDRKAGEGEGACLIFAHTAKAAKKVGHAQIADWFDTPWIDMGVRKLDKPHLFAEANPEKLAAEVPHVIESPKVCPVCEKWGGLPEGNGCEYCGGDDF
jgi:hypothetical protein